MTQTATRLPKFEGKPLIEIPDVIPVANFLEGEFGQAFLNEYNGRVNTDYNGAGALKVLSYNNGIVRGSNPFVVVVANKILAQEGIRTATPADLERVLNSKALSLQGTYEDSALVLRSTGDPNSYLAKNLAEQAKARGAKLNSPLVIPLNGLDVVYDAESPHKLAFKFTDGTQVIEAPILTKDGYFNSQDIDSNTGLPRKISGEGNRKLWTRNSGLSRLYLNGDLGLVSYYDDLANSDEDGRVVVVRGEAADAQNLRAQYEERKNELSVKANEALTILEQGYTDALKSLTK